MRMIALYTDFGNKDIYAGILKASLLSLSPENKVIDMSHNIDKHAIVQGAMFIKNSYSFLNNGSIHVALINSFYSKNAEFIFFKECDHFFIGPNNGLYSLVFPELDENKIKSIQPEDRSSKTQSFASLMRELGKLIFAISKEHIDDYPRVQEFNHRLNLKPVITADQIRASIIHIDNYGNVITNLDKVTFENACKGRKFSVYFQRNDPLKKIMNNYGDVGVGEVLSFFNSSSLLELAVNLGNVSDLFDLKINETIQIDFYA